MPMRRGQSRSAFEVASSGGSHVRGHRAGRGVQCVDRALVGGWGCATGLLDRASRPDTKHTDTKHTVDPGSGARRRVADRIGHAGPRGESIYRRTVPSTEILHPAGSAPRRRRVTRMIRPRQWKWLNDPAAAPRLACPGRPTDLAAGSPGRDAAPRTPRASKMVCAILERSGGGVISPQWTAITSKSSCPLTRDEQRTNG
jgi:hypothetical protein